MRKYHTHYKRFDRNGKNLLVLIHGISSPIFVWDRMLEYLDIKGYDYVIYDLWGRGKSDKPQTIYNTALYHAQLDYLLEDLRKLKKYKKYSYLGMSLGGWIAASYASRNQKNLDKLVLIDPLGFHLKTSRFATGLLGSRLTEGFLNKFSKTFFKYIVYLDFHDYKNTSHYQKKLMESLETKEQVKGFTHSVLSTLRNVLSEDMKTAYIDLEKRQNDILVIWGNKDSTIPYESSTRLKEVLPDSRFITIHDAGHIPHCEKAQETTDHINDFFQPR